MTFISLVVCGLLVWGMLLSFKCAWLGLGSEEPPKPPHAAKPVEDARPVHGEREVEDRELETAGAVSLTATPGKNPQGTGEASLA
jgi:hypothetical protein